MTCIGFIGAGKVGFSLGRLMAERGVALSGYASRALPSAEAAARFTGSRAFTSPESLLAASDTVFLTVPDDAVAPVWRGLRGGGRVSGKVLCHTSGFLSSEVFEGLAEEGGYGASLHPLMAVPDREGSWSLLADALYALEGDPEALARLGTLCAAMGVRTGVVDRAGKALYHCAAAVVSNCVVALAWEGERIFRSLGLEGSVPGLRALMARNAASAAERGPEAALTGPVERADAGTIRAHLAALAGEERELYRRLCLKLVELARVKHPGRDFRALAAVLESFAPEGRLA
ncbi:MAG: DUF2520 domain-containing protein [Deltaproteobacteria bacterium]|nr:DUF2520 domain-containing protein [Deltaproteobacteria bacterium]